MPNSHTSGGDNKKIGPLDPTCSFHGKKWSEHEGGRCLYCCLCFDSTLTPETCWADENGQKWDMCIPCGEMEQKMKEQHGSDHDTDH